jgi:hypothetical protein
LKIQGDCVAPKRQADCLCEGMICETLSRADSPRMTKSSGKLPPSPDSLTSQAMSRLPASINFSPRSWLRSTGPATAIRDSRKISRSSLCLLSTAKRARFAIGHYFVGGGGRVYHFSRPTFAKLSPSFSLSSAIISERSSPSRVRFAAPNNGAPLTTPGRSVASLDGERYAIHHAKAQAQGE